MTHYCYPFKYTYTFFLSLNPLSHFIKQNLWRNTISFLLIIRVYLPLSFYLSLHLSQSLLTYLNSSFQPFNIQEFYPVLPNISKLHLFHSLSHYHGFSTSTLFPSFLPVCILCLHFQLYIFFLYILLQIPVLMSSCPCPLARGEQSSHLRGFLAYQTRASTSASLGTSVNPCRHSSPRSSSIPDSTLHISLTRILSKPMVPFTRKSNIWSFTTLNRVVSPVYNTCTPN